MKKLFGFLFSLYLFIGFSSATDYTVTYGYTMNTADSNQSYWKGAVFVCTLPDCRLNQVTIQNTSDTCDDVSLLDGNNPWTTGALWTGKMVGTTVDIGYNLEPYKPYVLVRGSGFYISGASASPCTFYYNQITACSSAGNTPCRVHYGNDGFWVDGDVRLGGSWINQMNWTNSANYWKSFSFSGTSYGPPTPPNIYYNGVLNTGFVGTNIYLYGAYTLSLSGVDYIFNAQTYRTLLRQH